MDLFQLSVSQKQNKNHERKKGTYKKEGWW